MQDYTIEKAVDGTEISRDNCKTPFMICADFGLCRADPKNPTENRTIERYDENVLKPLIESGKISDGSKGGFDDRKMRYDSASFNFIPSSNCKYLEVKLGHSHFLDYREKRKRTKEESENLIQLGMDYFKDPYAFFGRNPGVTGIIKTLDKRIIVGRRKVELDRYEGLLQGVAGHLTYKQNPMNINLEEEMYREAEEETGTISQNIVSLEFLGLFSDPSVAGDDLDFTYLIGTDLSSEYFVEGHWREKVKKPEHSEFYAIPDYDSLQELIETGNFQDKNYDIVFSTRGPLKTLTKNDFE